ncbi:hypothetical protein Tco_1005708 [Tanacetum coccineum]|uniref:Uncharacterized protein n=1 Tax=Tanacetum coccineum TaxID=301880 RepID=A0ABQ5FGU0_9ASTR
MNKLLSYVTVTRGLKAYQSPNAKELKPNPKTPSLSGSECLNPRPFPGEKRVLDLSPSKSSNSSWPLGCCESDEVMKMVRVACRGDGGCGGFGSGGGGCGGDDVVGGSVVGRTGRSGAGKSGERRWSEGG